MAESTPLFCLVCNMASEGPEGSVFIQPCRCGYWVHDQCLINVSLHFEDYFPDTRSIGCKICRRAYNISPVKSCPLKFAVKYSSVYYQSFCYCSMELFVQLIADITFIKVGSLVLKKMYGLEEATRLISSMTPLRAVLTCQLVPVISIIITNIQWEHGLLQLLRKCSRLPLVGGVFPMEDPVLEDIFEDSYNFTLSFIGGLLLPFYALAASNLFNRWVEDPFDRFLLGGGTIVLFKGACRMYYKQQKYVQYCTFKIVDLAPQEKNRLTS